MCEILTWRKNGIECQLVRLRKPIPKCWKGQETLDGLHLRPCFLVSLLFFRQWCPLFLWQKVVWPFLERRTKWVFNSFQTCSWDALIFFVKSKKLKEIDFTNYFSARVNFCFFPYVLCGKIKKLLSLKNFVKSTIN